MPGGVEVAQAYITIIPSMKGIQGTIAKELNADVVGQKAGKALGTGISKGASKSSDALMKSFGSVGDRIAFKTQTGLSTAFKNVADGARKRMGGVAETIGTKFKAVGSAIGSTGIGKALTAAATVGAAAFTKLTGTMKGVAQFAGEAFKGVASRVQTALSPIAEKAGAIFGKVGEAAKRGFDKIAKYAAIGAAAATAAFGVFMKSAIDSYSEYQQLAGGAQQIFSGMDYSKWSNDAQEAYKTMGMSANQYLTAINQTGAAFKASMGNDAGYDTAKRGMQAISDYASGTGRNLDELNEKYALITRSTSSYQSIADQFSGILPATSKDFLEQAQSAGVLSKEYKNLTDVPIAEYQQAVTSMMESGVKSLGLAGNTAKEAEHTISGSMGMLKASWSNFLVELSKNDADVEARVGEVVDSTVAVIENVGPRVVKIVGALIDKVPSVLMEQAPKVTQALTDMLDGVTNGAFSKAVEAVRPYVERIGTAASGLWDRLKPLAPIVQEIGGKLGGILLKALGVATGAFEKVAPIIANIAEHALPILSSALDIVSQAFDAVMQVVEPIASFLTDTLAAAIDWIGQKLEELAQWISDSFGVIGDAAGAIGDFLKDPIGAITNFGKKATQSFDKTATAATKDADKAAKGTKKGYGEVNKSISDNTSKAATNANKNMGNAATNVSKQSDSAATSAEKNGKRIETAWNKSYTTKMSATASTGAAEKTMSDFKNKWTDFSVSGSAKLSTSSANTTLKDWIYRNDNFVLKGSVQIRSNATTHTMGYMAQGGIIQKHAAGFIANRPNTGVDITHHIVGERGAEAVVPLTNRAYVAPFARTVADFINEGRDGGVTITGNTFIVRRESDIDAIGRAINQQAERQRRAKL